MSEQRLRGHQFFALVSASLFACSVYDYQLGAGAAGSGAVSGSAGFAGFSGSFGATSSGGSSGSNGIGGSDGASGGSAGMQPLPGLVGWASIVACGGRGTTGGMGGPVVTITPGDASALNEAVRAEGPSTIEISGVFELGDTTLQISSDKTLVGTNGAEIRGAARVVRASNVILKNIKFNGGSTVGSSDALEIRASTCVWVDHCEFFDGADGNLDMVEGTDLVTVSFTRFYYTATANPHRLSNICGGDDTDTPDKLNVTFHHNWWGENILEEMPRVRYGKVHVFNNFYSAVDNSYCIGAGLWSKLLVENNVFDGVNDPITFAFDEEVDGSGVHTAQVVERGNDYDNATGEHVSLGASFSPPYPYALDPTDSVRTSVMASAGVQ